MAVFAAAYALIVTAVTIALAVPYLWLRYFAFT